jgi:hypothetical protein
MGIFSFVDRSRRLDFLLTIPQPLRTLSRHNCVLRPCLKSLWDQVLRRMGVELSKTNTQQRSTRCGSRSAQNGVKLSSYSSRAAAEVWDGDPGLKSITYASASVACLSPNEEDVIVKGVV